ncbi:MAG: histidine--tRNA ligase [Pseudomonadota bacterium]|nr:histidine--tRNA ligase [Pseudomonadota bacterium]
MTSEKKKKIKPEKPRGFEDISGNDLLSLLDLISKIEDTYKFYGFGKLETSTIELSDIIGSYLPDQDRPNEGVFSFEDEDGRWLSLRYDLTAGLARYVAENYDSLPKPFRRYQSGWVFRNEKPGPGRFRQFMQVDADTVGSANPLSDAEMCMMFSDVFENIGIKKKDYIIRLNNRNLLDALLNQTKISIRDNNDQYLTVMRSIDKLDRLGIKGVRELLGKGRKDKSGDFTKGADLSNEQIDLIINFLNQGEECKKMSRENALLNLNKTFCESDKFEEAIGELNSISSILDDLGYNEEKIAIDPSVVRGLGYYTGPIYEADLIFPKNEELNNFGSVGGGGRYDNLVDRLKGVKVPATGISIGVSRLLSAIKILNKDNINFTSVDAVVLIMDQSDKSFYFNLATQLRSEGIVTDLYMGDSNMKAQLKYADKKRARVAIIVGEDEKANNSVTIKDLFKGKEVSSEISENEEWRSGKGSQITVSIDKMVESIKDILKNSS